MTTCGEPPPSSEGVRLVGKPNKGRGLYREFLARSALESELKQFKPDLVYCCTSSAALVSRSLASLGHRTLFHCVGVMPEEWVMKRSDGKKEQLRASPREWLLTTIERRAVVFSDFLFSVSKPMSDHLAGKYGRRPHGVIRMIVNGELFKPDFGQRSKHRERMGLAADDILMNYAGGASVWQSVDIIEDQFEALRALEPRFKLLKIIRDDSGRRSTSNGAVFTENNLDQSEVASLMTACDIGVMQRDPHIVNRVASPIKLTEYLASGLPVIISPDVGDSSALVEHSDAGIVASNLASLTAQQLAQIIDPGVRGRWSYNARNLALSEFGVEQWVDTWHQLAAEITS